MKNYRLGFSLVELTVVLAIFAIVMSIILNDAPKFRDKTSLDLVSQNIALNIRGAQVYGVGTKVVGEDTLQSFGIHLNRDEEYNFLLFADGDDDGQFDGENFPVTCPNESGECLELYKLRGAKIKNICFKDGPSEFCNNDDTRRLIEILYTRPQSEANFCIRLDYQSDCSDNLNVSFVKILITNTRESERRIITIWKNGQISVEKPDNL